jgi:hypothetical protein
MDGHSRRQRGGGWRWKINPIFFDEPPRDYQDDAADHEPEGYRVTEKSEIAAQEAETD